jgi:hypothetical protein
VRAQCGLFIAGGILGRPTAPGRAVVQRAWRRPVVLGAQRLASSSALSPIAVWRLTLIGEPEPLSPLGLARGLWARSLCFWGLNPARGWRHSSGNDYLAHQSEARQAAQ